MWFLDGNSSNIGAERNVLDGLNLLFSLVHSFMAETENGDMWDGLNSFSSVSFTQFSPVSNCGAALSWWGKLTGHVGCSNCSTSSSLLSNAISHY